MFCPNCGKELPDGTKFCSQCGARLNDIEEKNTDEVPDSVGMNQQAAAEQTAGGSGKKPGQKHTGRIIAIIVAAVVVIAAVIVIILVTGHDESGPIPSPSDSESVSDKKTGGDTLTIQVGVFVRWEDEPTYDLTDSANVYGILSDVDRENTDQALEEFELKYGFYPQTAEYNETVALADSLLETRKSDAIILNTAYLQLLEESEGYEDIMDRIVQIETFNIEVKDQEIDNTAFTVYISGIDSQGGLQWSSLSDTNIIATVNTETHQVLLLTTPRDYYIPLSISNGEKDKLTHAGIYGVNVSMDTLSMLYNVPMDYYFRIDFDGFKEIVDALGGITVYSDFAFESQNAEGYSFVKGENEMDGEAALAFCRERYSFEDGDLQRGRNNLAVLEAIIQKAASPALLTGYEDILNAAKDNFETNIPNDLITEIVRDVEKTGIDDWNIVGTSVGGDSSMEVTYTQQVEASVVIPDDDAVAEAAQLMKVILNGEIIKQAVPETLGSGNSESSSEAPSQSAEPAEGNEPETDETTGFVIIDVDLSDYTDKDKVNVTITVDGVTQVNNEVATSIGTYETKIIGEGIAVVTVSIDGTLVASFDEDFT